MRTVIAAHTALTLLPATAAAHVTIDPSGTPGGYGVETLRVPNARGPLNTPPSREREAPAPAVAPARSCCWLVPVAVFVALAVLVSPLVALTMAPALLLFAVLLRGHLPGEELIERLRGRRRPERSRRVVGEVAPPRLVLVVRAAGRALAVALAMRPPPRAALAPGV